MNSFEENRREIKLYDDQHYLVIKGKKDKNFVCFFVYKLDLFHLTWNSTKRFTEVLSNVALQRSYETIDGKFN